MIDLIEKEFEEPISDKINEGTLSNQQVEIDFIGSTLNLGRGKLSLLFDCGAGRDR